jgi:DNA polymerase I - 3''-5'' exonuclease and polymerase domains
MVKTLAIDIETYSPVDLTKSGVYPYVEHPEFEILLFAYSFCNGPITCVDLASGEKLPEVVLASLTNPNVIKTAWNANFERICISRYFGVELPIEQWECTMIKSAMLGLPLALGAAAKVLKLEQEKMQIGKALIRYFSVPCKPTKANGERNRNLPEHDLEKWKLFMEYCIRDVKVEKDIRHKISFFTISDEEKKLYVLDQIINDRGIQLDMGMVHNAIEIDSIHTTKLSTLATDITSLDNVNSVSQLKQWITEETGIEVDSLSKESIPEILKSTSDKNVADILRIRQEMAKTSVKKYEAMTNAVCRDNRVRGLLQFYGANRTGRWAGRLVQVQNLPQNHLLDLDLARTLVRENDLEMLEMLFGNVPDTLSQLIRTAFVAEEGHTFVVADFSAIEARVIAWLADEKWRLEVFNTHGKIYEASASAMFKVPIEEITKGSPLRQKGKIAELALGYGGSTGALETMGALKMGLSDTELKPLVIAWRNANKAIVSFWSEVEDAAMKAIENKSSISVRHGIRFEYESGILFIILPSGRKLSYLRPRIGTNRFGGNSIQYEGMNQTTKQWMLLETYGGKLVENIVQAVARDCLAYSMLNLEKAGFKIVCHVHDEVIIEIDQNKDCLNEVCEIMGQPVSWAKGLPLRADGYVTHYYKKD